MEEVKVIELTEKDSVNPNHYVIIETEDGTRKMRAKYLRSLTAKSLYFDTVEDMKTSDNELVEGDICTTLGYHKPGDGGGSKYIITYNPGALQDGRYVHYLSYSDTLRAEILLEDTVNVHQFGAYGDGAHDDYEAIQAAIDSDKTVIFNNNATYVTRLSLQIKKNDYILDCNMCTILPKFVNAFILGDSSENPVNYKNITLQNVRIDSKDSTDALFISYATANLKNVKIEEANKAIKVFCSHLQIDGLYIHGAMDDKDKSIGISFTGSGDKKRCEFDGRNMEFYQIKTGIALQSGDDHSIRCKQVLFDVNNLVPSALFMNVGVPSRMIIIDGYNGTKYAKIIYVAAKANATAIDIRDLCRFANNAISVLSDTSVLHLSGSVYNDDDSFISADRQNIFGQMQCELYTNVAWATHIVDNDAYTTAGVDHSGRLTDSIDARNYPELEVSSAVFTIDTLRNMCINFIASTANITEIKGGIDGQILAIRSETNRNIVRTVGKIELPGSSVQLNPFNYILLQKVNNIWRQIG